MPVDPPSRIRLGASAGALGAAFALALVTGAGPVPSVFQLTGATEDLSGSCDELEHAGDPACAGDLTARSTDDADDDRADDESTTTTTTGGPAPAVAPIVASEVRTVSAGDAGSIIVAIEGGTLQLLTASPNPGWSVEVEHASGHEIEVQFSSGSQRVDVEVELEDGAVRERVRLHDGPDSDSDDDSDSSGPASSSPSGDDDGDRSGPRVADDTDDDDSDRSGPSVDSDSDDDDSSGHDSDDGPGHD